LRLSFYTAIAAWRARRLRRIEALEFGFPCLCQFDAARHPAHETSIDQALQFRLGKAAREPRLRTRYSAQLHFQLLRCDIHISPSALTAPAD
jgi:hypothetical protein